MATTSITHTATAMDRALQTIRTRWGSDAIVVADKTESARRSALRPADNHSLSGALAPLDAYVQPGQLLEITGTASSGKSTLALAMLAALQRRRSGMVVYVDTPHTFYPPAAAQLGIDLRRLWVVRLDNWMDTLAAVEVLVQSGIVDALVWDLVACRETLTYGQLRRLRLAATLHDAHLILLTTRPARSGSRPLDNAAQCRLVVHRRGIIWEQLGSQHVLAGYKLEIDVARAPGMRHAQPFEIALSDQHRRAWT